MLGSAPLKRSNQSNVHRHGLSDNTDFQHDERYARKLAALQHGLRDPEGHLTSFGETFSGRYRPPCPICLENASDSACFVSECGHAFCEPCIRQHVIHIATGTKAYPVTCPDCRADMDPQRCLTLLAGTGEAYEALEKLILERTYFDRIRYCANPSCASPFDWLPTPQARGYSDEFKVTCPLCETATCVMCKVKWHPNQTCQQFAAENENKDALVRLAREKEWRECPSCGHFIEKHLGDCNFVKCRCGCGLCHKCGVAYRSVVPTLQNQHGEPGCRCGLFDPGYVAPVPQAGLLQAPVLVRNPYRFDANLPQPHRYQHRVPVVPVLRVIPVMPAVHPYPYAIENDGGNELLNARRGRNGVISIDSILQGLRRRRLPIAMQYDISNATCPYPECESEFPSLKALEQHLADVQWHPVWLCCGRPFYTESCRQKHVEAVHGGQM